MVRFEVTSDHGIDVGVDGEALQMAPPLRFAVRPAAVVVRRPTHAFGYSPSARHLGTRAVLGTLWHTAWGRTPGPAAVTPPSDPLRERP